MRTLSHVFFVDPSPVRRVPIPTGIQRKLNFVSVRTIKGSSSSRFRCRVRLGLLSKSLGLLSKGGLPDMSSRVKRDLEEVLEKKVRSADKKCVPVRARSLHGGEADRGPARRQLRARVRQGWRGGEDQDVRTGLIHSIVVRKR